MATTLHGGSSLAIFSHLLIFSTVAFFLPDFFGAGSGFGFGFAIGVWGRSYLVVEPSVSSMKIEFRKRKTIFAAIFSAVETIYCCQHLFNARKFKYNACLPIFTILNQNYG